MPAKVMERNEESKLNALFALGMMRFKLSAKHWLLLCEIYATVARRVRREI